MLSWVVLPTLVGVALSGSSEPGKIIYIFYPIGILYPCIVFNNFTP